VRRSDLLSGSRWLSTGQDWPLSAGPKRSTDSTRAKAPQHTQILQSDAVICRHVLISIIFEYQL
jgi:hypothetical protein